MGDRLGTCGTVLRLVLGLRRVTEHRLRETARSGKCLFRYRGGNVSEQEAPAGCVCCDWFDYDAVCVIGEFERRAGSGGTRQGIARNAWPAERMRPVGGV